MAPRGSVRRSTATSLDAASEYLVVLEELKATVRTAQVRAHVVVNTELLQLYWRIGRAISQRRDVEGWGTKIVARLAGDLRREFPEMSGFSQRSLTYMRTFAEAWPATRFAQQPVAQLPWGHVTVLLDRLAEQPVREWYAVHAAASGWSRAVLLNQIKSQLHTRLGAAPSNFRAALPATDSDLATQLVKDPYNFEFLGVTGVLAERDLERRLMEQIQQFLLELGEGFALYGRQYRFSVGRKDFVIDLVFFNVTHNRFIIIELKVDSFEPAHLGQLQFYVEWAENHLRLPHHLPTVGILLVADKEDVIVRYALAGAVATYTYDNLPAATRRELPSTGSLTDAVRHTPPTPRPRPKRNRPT